jgi:hypothetical protein
MELAKKKGDMVFMLGHGEYKLASRKSVMECCEKVGLIVEKFEIRKGMRNYLSVNRKNGRMK